MEELKAVAEDPSRPAEGVRFAVRDAQRLAMAQPGGRRPSTSGSSTRSSNGWRTRRTGSPGPTRTTGPTSRSWSPSRRPPATW
ncbi:hypothetical protein [Actinomadura madurae]|uniref:hypothetical protein n=1 Tax=Actinomadura madurae TaxID=1993 RepID=UPI0020D24CCC|nr:hypothetical protein [Actinomadura madurae]MCP9983898.1 hypothetical protein [Actinomadura madurae]